MKEELDEVENKKRQPQTHHRTKEPGEWEDKYMDIFAGSIFRSGNEEGWECRSEFFGIWVKFAWGEQKIGLSLMSAQGIQFLRRVHWFWHDEDFKFHQGSYLGFSDFYFRNLAESLNLIITISSTSVNSIKNNSTEYQKLMIILWN